jgi:hypothetical protein
MAGQALPYAQAVSYIACDVPDGMRLATWRATKRPRPQRRRAVPRLHRRR